MLIYEAWNFYREVSEEEEELKEGTGREKES